MYLKYVWDIHDMFRLKEIVKQCDHILGRYLWTIGMDKCSSMCLSLKTTNACQTYFLLFT